MEDGKTRWPELVGIDVDKAIELIQTENPSLDVKKTQENSPVTRDFRPNRVRVFYNTSTNLVVGVPKTG